MVKLISSLAPRQVQSLQRPPQPRRLIDLHDGTMVTSDGTFLFAPRNSPRFLPLPPPEDSSFEWRKEIPKCVAATAIAWTVYSLAQRFLRPESIDEKILTSVSSAFCAVAVTAFFFRPTQPQEVIKKIALCTGIAATYFFLKRSYCWLRS